MMVVMTMVTLVTFHWCRDNGDIGDYDDNGDVIDDSDNGDIGDGDYYNGDIDGDGDRDNGDE